MDKVLHSTGMSRVSVGTEIKLPYRPVAGLGTSTVPESSRCMYFKKSHPDTFGNWSGSSLCVSARGISAVSVCAHMPPKVVTLRERAAYLRDAADEQAGSIDGTSTLVSQLGDKVADHGKKKGLRKGQSSADLFQLWDKNGNSHLSKMEFRVAARKLELDGANDTKEVDKLFKQLDKDGDGNLNTSDNEFKAAVKMLKKESSSAIDRKAEALSQIEHKRSMAVQCEAAAVALEAVDMAKAALTSFEQLKGASVMRRVGSVLLRIGFKAADMAHKWDTNRDGTVDKAEVIEGLRGLGVQASDAELGAFFDSIDKDHDGSLDLAEARKMHRAFNVDKAAFDARRVELKAVIDEAKAAAKAVLRVLEELEATGATAGAAAGRAAAKAPKGRAATQAMPNDGDDTAKKTAPTGAGTSASSEVRVAVELDQPRAVKVAFATPDEDAYQC